jgi:uncharacterized membrane protein YhaH (DUF805 family)
MRGRMNRATYWLCLTIILTVVGIMSAFGVRPPRVGEAMLILMCAPRLHDLGRSGWWVLIPLGIEVVAVVAGVTVVPAEDTYVVFSGAFAVVAGFIVLLGLVPGDAQANRFGEPAKSPFAFRERAKVARTEEIFK